MAKCHETQFTVSKVPGQGRIGGLSSPLHLQIFAKLPPWSPPLQRSDKGVYSTRTLAHCVQRLGSSGHPQKCSSSIGDGPRTSTFIFHVPRSDPDEVREWTLPSWPGCSDSRSAITRPALCARTRPGLRRPSRRSMCVDSVSSSDSSRYSSRYSSSSDATTRHADAAATRASPAGMRAIGSSAPCCYPRTCRRSTNDTRW